MNILTFVNDTVLFITLVPTQNKCNDVVGESSCPSKEVNKGEDLPVWGEDLCCDCNSLQSHHEKQCWSSSISRHKT